ncbi:hypothetical protein D3C76_1529860 [compost metagenome]
MQRVLGELQLLAGPAGQQVDAGLHHQAAEGLGQAAGGRCIDQHLNDLAAAVVAHQVGAHLLQVIGDGLARARYITGAQAFGHQGDFGIVGILVGRR